MIKKIPFAVQIIIILACGTILTAAVYCVIRFTKINPSKTSLPEYTVTFAKQSGEVVKTEKVIEGRGVFPPEISLPGVFQGWSKAINNVKADMEVHPLYYSVSDENLFCFDSVYVKEGEKFTIKLLLTGKVNISSAELTISYDPAVMTFLGADNQKYCEVSDSKDGNLILKLKNNKVISTTATLAEIKFKALKKDVLSTQIDLACKNAKTKQSGAEIPATVSTLNNKVFYLQEVD